MADWLADYEILLGVSGGIAAYKAAYLCSQLVQKRAGVTVVMTENAQEFIRPLTFSTLTGRKVYTDMFAAQQVYDAQHISLTERADLLVVAPATANIMAKAAHGLCDDLLSTLICAADSPVLMAPAMNPRMWYNQATLANAQTLQDRGIRFVGPESGRMACGDEGLGRMSDPQDILYCIEEILATHEPKKKALGTRH